MKSSLRQKYFASITTLGLKEGATPNEIKQAYRNLSKKYHPDIYQGDNGDTFKEISSAYLFLKKHPEPPQEVYQSNTAGNASTGQHENDIDRRRSRYWAKKAEEAELKKQMYAWIFSKGRVIVFALIFLNTLLAVDYFMPKNIIQSDILSYKYIRQRSSRYSNGDEFLYDLKFKSGQKIRIAHTSGFLFKKGEKYQVYETPIFKQTTFIKPIEQPEITLHQSYGIFKVFGFIIPLTLIGSFFYFYGVKNNDYRLTLLLVLLMCGLIQLGILLSS